MTKGPISQMVLDPKVYSTLKEHPDQLVRYVQLCHLMFQLCVFLYKKYFDVKKTDNRKEWLLKTAVNNVANLENVKSCFIASLIIFLIIVFFKISRESLGSRSFFWSLSLGVLFLILFWGFWGNYALR